MKNVWIALAAVLAIAAAVFGTLRDFDKAFILAALGAVSWFLSYRVQMKELVDDQSEEKQEETDDEEI